MHGWLSKHKQASEKNINSITVSLHFSEASSVCYKEDTAFAVNTAFCQNVSLIMDYRH